MNDAAATALTSADTLKFPQPRSTAAVLVRRVDRDPSVVWIVPQPFRLAWAEPKVGRHTPDLLTVHSDGGVTVWDARGADDQGSKFRAKAAITASECEAVGWRYEVCRLPG